MEVQSNKNGGVIYINMIATIILAVVALTPYLERNVTEITKVGLLLIWIVTAIPSGFSLRNDIAKWWLLYIVYQSLTMLIGHSTMSLNAEIARLPIYFTPIIMAHIVSSYNITQKTRLMWMLLMVLLYNIVTNVVIGFQNPEIYNTLNVVERGDSDLLTNAGSTSFVAVCLFVIPVGWLLYRNSQTKIAKFIYLLILALSFYYMIFINSRATALLLLIIMIVGYMMPVEESSNTQSKKSTKWIRYVILGAAVYLGLIPFLELLASFFDGMDGMAGRLAGRMTDIISLIQVGGDVDSMDDGSFLKRLLLWQTSWNTFVASFPNFLFGIGEDVHLSDYYSLLACGVGSHSTILDCLAQYGIIGGFLLYKCLKTPFQYILQLTDTHLLRKRVNIVLIVFVIYSLLNVSLSAELLVVIFILYPLVIIRINNYGKSSL